MSLAALIRRLSDAGAPPEAIAIAIEAVEAAIEGPRAAARERKRRQRSDVTGRSRDGHGTERDNPSPSPSLEGSPEPPPRTLTLSPSEKFSSKRARPDEFELFWSNYPRKTAKGEARKAYASALGRVSGPDPPAVLLAALALQSDQWTERRFTPHASTWLNQDRWEDEIPTANSKVKPANVHESFAERDARHRRENLERSFAASERVVDLARRRRGEISDSEPTDAFG